MRDSSEVGFATPVGQEVGYAHGPIRPERTLADERSTDPHETKGLPRYSVENAHGIIGPDVGLGDQNVPFEALALVEEVLFGDRNDDADSCGDIGSR